MTAPSGVTAWQTLSVALPRRDIHAAMERAKTLRNAIAHHQVLLKDSQRETSDERLERGVIAIRRRRRSSPTNFAQLTQKNS